MGRVKVKGKTVDGVTVARRIVLRDIVFRALEKSKGHGITSDDIWRELENSGSNIPKDFTARNIGPIFRALHQRGYLKKGTEFRLSDRQSPRPLPIYYSGEQATIWSKEEKD